MPPLAPEAQWLCDPAAVPFPCWRASRGIGVGLGNPHALCFMNSVLQALAYTPGLADDCIEGRHRLSCFSRHGKAASRGSRESSSHGGSRGDSDVSISFCAFCMLELQVLAIHQKGREGSPQKNFSKGWVQNQLAPYIKPFVWRGFRPGRQEDAHEFFRFFLDALMKSPSTAAAAALQQQQHQQKPRKEVKPEVALTSYFGRLFGSWLRSSVVCTECGRASVRFESAIDIPLDIGCSSGAPMAGIPHLRGGPRSGPPQKPYALEKALARFIAKETLSGNNAYMCQRCSKKVTATKQLQLFTAPHVLVFALKRFSLSVSHGFPLPVKCHRPVSFPSSLNLLPYMAPEAVKVHQQQLQQQLQQGVQEQELKPPEKSERNQGSAGSTTASSSSPSSSPPYSRSPSSSVNFNAPVRTPTVYSPAATNSSSGGASSPSPSYLYRLFAVVSHAGGSLSSGHYRAFVRAPVASNQTPGQAATTEGATNWLAIDDEMVSVVSEAAVLCRLQQEAYLLFYSKIPSKAEVHQQQKQQQQQQQKQRQQDKQSQYLQHEKEVETTAYVETGGMSDSTSISSLEPELSTSEDEWSDCSSSTSTCSSDSSARDSDEATSRSDALPFLLQLRKIQERRKVTLSHRRRVLLAFQCHFLVKGFHEARRKATVLRLKRNQQKLLQLQKEQPVKQMQQQEQRPQQKQQQECQPRAITMMTPEAMGERKQNAASRQRQFGCSTAGPWEVEQQEVTATAAAEKELFEKLQILQQPLPNKRSRHDREYDLGRVKKVKDPLRHKPVGAATIVATQAESEVGAFVVQQRAAFDALQQKGSRPHRGGFLPSQKKRKLAKKRGGPHYHKGPKGAGRKGKKFA